MQQQNANPQVLPNGFSYQSRVLSAQKSLYLFDYLSEKLNWQQPEITVYGKTGPIPRLQCFISDPNLVYGYSGKKLKAEPWTDILLLMRARLERYLQQPFNSILINYYRNGHDSMGWHSDNEVELGLYPTIVCISLGAERMFKLKHKVSEKITNIKLESGSCLIMSGNSQQDYLHALPRQISLKHPRISLTFRYINAK